MGTEPEMSDESSLNVTVDLATLTNTQRGQLAELAFMRKAASLGFSVSKPWQEGERYDVIVRVNEVFWRVQVKSVLVKAPCKSHYRIKTSGGKKYSRQTPYSAHEIDFLVAYIFPEDLWYVFPITVVEHHKVICVLAWIEEFPFRTISRGLGASANHRTRRHGKQDFDPGCRRARGAGLHLISESHRGTRSRTQTSPRHECATKQVVWGRALLPVHVKRGSTATCAQKFADKSARATQSRWTGWGDRRSEDLESSAGDAESDRGLADELSIGVDVDGRFCLNADGIGLGVFHLFESQVTTEIDGRKKTEEFEDVHPADDAEVELAVGKFGVRGDGHASAIGRSIGDGGENGGSSGCRGTVCTYCHGKRRKAEELRRSTESVAAAAAKPCRKAIGASGNIAIDSDSGDTTEVTLCGRARGTYSADNPEVNVL